MPDTLRLDSSKPDIQQAAKILAQGGIVAFGTETVYGLGADARNDKAVAQVYAAKGRPSFNPLIIHLPDFESAQKYGVFNDVATELANTFWPGSLSIVVPLAKDAGICKLVTAGLDTVAIRIPNHDGARALLKEFNGPIAAPSANPSGRISPTTAAHVLEGLDGKIDAVIDSGACAVGLESTIVMPLQDNQVALLRAGGVSVEDIAQKIGVKPLSQDQPDTPISPGQLAAHYAPNLPLRINVTEPNPNEAFLGFGPYHGDLNLSPEADVIEAAANLFAYMRKIDASAQHSGKSGLAIAPIPHHGLGLAINDRLKRAAHSQD